MESISTDKIQFIHTINKQNLNVNRYLFSQKHMLNKLIKKANNLLNKQNDRQKK